MIGEKIHCLSIYISLKKLQLAQLSIILENVLKLNNSNLCKKQNKTKHTSILKVENVFKKLLIYKQLLSFGIPYVKNGAQAVQGPQVFIVIVN